MIHETGATDGLFALNIAAKPAIQVLGGRIPVLIVDDIFADPIGIRQSALNLDFRPPPYPYPGRLALLDNEEPSVKAYLRTVLELVNSGYLPRIPAISKNGRPIYRFGRVEADFAVTDVHPDELSSVQEAPHVDPVPIFGLVYLNETDRGGTLFFDRSAASGGGQRRGYFTDGDREYQLVGKIEGRFNRLAIYPGFVPHTGEIKGDWIRTDERFINPRLTQRLVFFP